MKTKWKTIGFDRKIQRIWLDATADWAAEGISASEIRTRVQDLLEGRVAGEGPHSARGKTITVLMHIWVPVPKTLASLRHDGLDLIRGTVGEGKLPVHWGMCLATYPFFQDVAAITGRLLSLQTTVDLSQLIRRVEESWGARSTIPRAVQRVVRSLVDWGALTETAHRGTFQSCQPIPLSSKNGVGIWLLEAAIVGSGRLARPLVGTIRHPMFFPFHITVTPQDVANSTRLELYRQGSDEDLVIIKRTVTSNEADRNQQPRLLL